MAHKEQIEFCETVKALHPSKFEGVNVIDAGSLDINGSNEYLFTDCNYVGVDVIPGKNVKHITPIHLFSPTFKVHTIISTEMLEHDEYWKQSLAHMYMILEKGGLMVITCAAPGRVEHGTHRSQPHCSPGTLDYYKNLKVSDIWSVLKKELFNGTYYMKQVGEDIQFFGIKK